MGERVGRSDRGGDIERITRRIALAIAFFLVVAVPAQYAVTGYVHQVQIIEQVGHHASNGLLRVSYLYPEIWQYQEHRLSELLQWALLDTEKMRIELRTDRGVLLGRVGTESRLPAIERRFEVRDVNRLIAEFRVASPVGGLVAETMAVAILGLIPAILFYLGLKLVPFRLLETAWTRLRGYQTQLREEMNDKVRALRRLREAQERMEFLSIHDALTGLANRNLLRQQALLTLAKARRENSRVALVLADLDGFREINETHGNDIGDHVLRVIGHRLKRMLRDADVVARLGNDEYAVLLTQIDDATVDQLARRIRELVARPVVTEDSTLHVQASIGLAWYPDHAKDYPGLLRNADLATEQARRRGSGHAVFDPDTGNLISGMSALAQSLASAITDRHMQVAYQPIVGMDRRLVAVEALLRWQDPRLGQVEPDEFIPAAERHGLIAELTDFLLEQALVQLARWDHLHPDLELCINLSPQLLLDEQMPRRLLQTLKRHSVQPQRLCLEFTEHGVMTDPVLAKRRIGEYARAGIRLAVDDFGTGYSSLAHIAALELNVMKIDGSFVREMLDQPWARNVVACAVGVGRGMGVKVLAEGVETLAQWEALEHLGCDLAQGYLIGKPVDADQFTRLLGRERLVLAQTARPQPA